MYRRTTIAAVATALTLLGGGSALAANAGLFDGDRPDGAGTLPAVTTPDDGTPSGPATDVAPPPADHGDAYEDGSPEDDDRDEDGSPEDEDGDEGSEDGEGERDD
ncbi:hypothetical protein [Geodermatophilus sp. SYSU D00684]